MILKRAAVVLAGALAAVVLPTTTASADIYNPTTMEYIPTSYYYPPPSPSYDPPPLYFPPIWTNTSTSSGSGSGSSTPAKPTREERILSYKRSTRVSKQANRQMAKVFAKRLGKGNFDRKRFIKEADKGTFRKAFKQLVKPLGWSDTNYADAVAAYTVASYLIANQIPLEDMTSDERMGARKVRDLVAEALVKNKKMRKMSARGKQIATERLNTQTIVMLVQFAAGDAAQRAAQAAGTRAAGMITFQGDLTTVELDWTGFEPR